MAELWAAALATVAVGAYSANKQSQAGKKGAKAAQQAADADRAEQQRQFDITNANYEPFRQAGLGALGRQEAYLNGDMSGFLDSAQYKGAYTQGLGTLDRSAAARGALYSGGTDADRITFGANLATQFGDNYWGKLAAQANQGYNTTGQLASYGQAMANRNGETGFGVANARAGAYQNSANAWGNFAQQVGGMASQYSQQRRA